VGRDGRRAELGSGHHGVHTRKLQGEGKIEGAQLEVERGYKGRRWMGGGLGGGAAVSSSSPMPWRAERERIGREQRG
jgi:hypothetical protein